MHNRNKLVAFFSGELTNDMNSPHGVGYEAYTIQDLHEVCREHFGNCYTYSEIRGAAQEMVLKGLWFQVVDEADFRKSSFITYMLKRVEDARARAKAA